MAASDVLLDVRDLSVAYGSIQAVRGVSLRVHHGELVTLLGANGAGKSTVLKAILGVQRARAGRILFRGEDVTRRPVDGIVAAGIVLVPEGRGILKEMTVLENLELGAYHRRGPLTESLARVFALFPILRERREQKAGALSGGQQQMLAIARAMMAEPALIMLDEPSLGLAPIVVQQLFGTLADLHAAGHTILLAEQNARKALQLANRGYVFERGRVVLEGASRDLAADPQVRQAYLGG